MLKRDRRVTTVATVVKDVLSHLELWAKTREQQAAIVWDEVVGGPIAAKTEVIEASRGVLHVRAHTPVWAQELTMQEAEIRRRLSEKLGGDFIREIRFSTRGPFHPRQEQPQEPAVPRPTRGELAAVTLDAAEKAEITEAARDAATPELAASVQRAMNAQMRLSKWRAQHGWRPCCKCGELTYGAQECAACRVAGRERP